MPKESKLAAMDKLQKQDVKGASFPGPLFQLQALNKKMEKVEVCCTCINIYLCLQNNRTVQ